MKTAYALTFKEIIDRIKRGQQYITWGGTHTQVQENGQWITKWSGGQKILILHILATYAKQFGFTLEEMETVEELHPSTRSAIWLEFNLSNFSKPR